MYIILNNKAVLSVSGTTTRCGHL